MMAPIVSFNIVKLRTQLATAGSGYDAIVREELDAALANHSEREVYHDVVRSWLHARPFSEEWEFYHAIKRGFDSYNLGATSRKPFLTASTTPTALSLFTSLDRRVPTQRPLHSSFKLNPPSRAGVSLPRDVPEHSPDHMATHSAQANAKTGYVDDNRGECKFKGNPVEKNQEHAVDTSGLCQNELVEGDFVVVDSRPSSPELYYISDDDEVVCLSPSSPKN